MSTPYDRAKPPRQKVVELHGCRVCGADPTHFSDTSKTAAPLCDNCDTVPWTVYTPAAALTAFVAPVPSPLLGLFLLMAVLGWVCWWVDR